jgi:hypothetical protein
MSTDMIATSPAPDDQNPVAEAKPETVKATTAFDRATELSSVVPNARFRIEEHQRNPTILGDAELIEVNQKIGPGFKRSNQYFYEYFDECRPHIYELNRRYARKGHRLPIEGNPTYEEFVYETFGVTARYLRMLLNPQKTAKKKTSEPLDLGDVAALFARMKRKSFLTGMDQVLKELEPEDFATALEDFAQLIADHYSQPEVTVSITAPSDGEDDGDSGYDAADTDPAYESGGEHELACV